MSRPISDEAQAAVLAAVEVHGFGQVLHVLATQAERELKARVDSPPGSTKAMEHSVFAQVAVNLNMAAGEATQANL